MAEAHPGRVGRRLAAIVAADDVAGYSRLMHDDAAAFAKASKSLPLPDKPSIAVLPFQNMSGDPEQDISPTVSLKKRGCR